MVSPLAALAARMISLQLIFGMQVRGHGSGGGVGGGGLGGKGGGESGGEGGLHAQPEQSHPFASSDAHVYLLSCESRRPNVLALLETFSQYSQF